MAIKVNKMVGPQIRKDLLSEESKLPLLWGVLALFGVALQAATQYFADTFGYQTSLNGHIGHHVYVPWAIIQWSIKWYNRYPNECVKAWNIGGVIFGAGILCIVAIKLTTANRLKGLTRKEYILQGSARWANKKDIQQAGLLPKRRTLFEFLTRKSPASVGVYLGGWKDKNGKFYYLRHNGPEHVLTFAPARSGKGVSLVIPTLLSWPGSAIITDLKDELWHLTAGWRKQHAGNKVLRFEPASSNGSACWNPLDEIRLGTENELGDVQNLVAIILDPDGSGLVSQTHKKAFAFLVDVLLYALNEARNKGTSVSLASVEAMLQEITLSGQYDDTGAVLSTVKFYLSIYRDPNVSRNTSKSDFKIKDLLNSDSPISIYLITKPNDKIRLKPLMRILLNLIFRSITNVKFDISRNANNRCQHRLLCMLDNVINLGRLSFLEEALINSFGCGINFYITCNDLRQIKNSETGYGPDELITSNCKIKNTFTPNRIDTAEYLSSMSGQTTVLREHVTTTTAGRGLASGHRSKSHSIQELRRPLLTADEYLQIPESRKNDYGEIVEPGDMIIYVSGYPAIYGTQPLFFNDPIFHSRAKIKAPQSSDVLTVWEISSSVKNSDSDFALIVMPSINTKLASSEKEDELWQLIIKK